MPPGTHPDSLPDNWFCYNHPDPAKAALSHTAHEEAYKIPAEAEVTALTALYLPSRMLLYICCTEPGERLPELLEPAHANEQRGGESLATCQHATHDVMVLWTYSGHCQLECFHPHNTRTWSSSPLTTRDIICSMTSFTNRCGYCISIHVQVAPCWLLPSRLPSTKEGASFRLQSGSASLGTRRLQNWHRSRGSCRSGSNKRYAL